MHYQQYQINKSILFFDFVCCILLVTEIMIVIRDSLIELHGIVKQRDPPAL